MRYSPIPAEFYTRNRKNVFKHLKPNSVVIVQSNDVLPTNADGHMGFHQQNDLLYLSGIDQEETILLLFPDAPLQEWREILFVKETSEHIKIWEGNKLTKSEATDLSGIKNVKWNSEFPGLLQAIVNSAESIYLATIHAVPEFRRQGGGSFINIASTAGVRPRPGLTWYNGSKGAVITTSKSLAAELGPDNIRVNCINPVFNPDTGLSAEFAGGL